MGDARASSKGRAVPRWALALVAIILGVGLVAGIGPSHGPVVGLTWVLIRLVESIGSPLAYGAGAAGLGILASGVFRGAQPGDRPWLALALGLAAMLTCSHTLGWMGGLRTWWTAVLPIALGVGGLTFGAWRWLAQDHDDETSGAALGEAGVWRWGVLPRLRVSTIASCVGIAVLLTAACSTPGLLWGSEFGGFDALSYHLQLPREWLEGGRLEPLRHNVYSYLPSYVEAAYMHLGALHDAPWTGRGRMPLVASGWTVSCQLLHAAMGVLAAGLIGRCADGAARMAGLDERARSAARMVAWAITLVTPWTAVTGSLAYNEMGTISLGAAGMLIALQDGMNPTRRGTLTGLLIGGACCCKPTAIFMLGPTAGILLLAGMPARTWWKAAAAGSLAGVLMLAPWLVRNALAGGNPVFPQMAGAFGAAHWSAEQVARYAAAHRSDLGLLDRAKLLLWPEAMKSGMLAQRGLLHPQFFAFLPLVAVSVGAMVMSRWRRRLARPVLLFSAAWLLQLAGWLTLTHIQSRFLLPALVTGGPLIGLAMAMAVSEHGVFGSADAKGQSTRRKSIRLRRRVLIATINAGLVTQACWLVMLFGQQGRGEPNRFLLVTPDAITGEAFRGAYERADARERGRLESEMMLETFVNLALGPNPGTVYLLGDSTPLYLTVPVLTHTTYDESPLGRAMRESPDDADAWARALWDRGVRFIVFNPAEIERLHRSGWYDPLVTSEAARTFLSERAELVRAWPEQGRALYRLAPPGGHGT